MCPGATADANHPRSTLPTRTPRAAEIVLGLCLLLLPPVLALVPRGVASLVAVAALAAAGIASARPARLAPLGPPALILGALLLWGLASASWSITPARSLVMELRLLGLFAAALALAAAAGRVAAPSRLGRLALLGTGIGITLALFDLASGGGITEHFSIRPFAAPRLNPLAAWLAIVALPAAAWLATGGRRIGALAAAAGMLAAVLVLADTTAKIALLFSLPVAALAYWRRGTVARAAAVLSVAAILMAPVLLPPLARIPALFAAADAFKSSAGHRLLIWSFTGDRIAERPFLGWGLDTARAIPGGKEEIRPGQEWLPLHTHDAALQLWLELGAPGAALFALLVGWLWLRLAAAAWPRTYAAAAAGSLSAALAIALSGWGIWEEWWVATLSLALFLVLAMARGSLSPAATPPPRRAPRGGGR